MKKYDVIAIGELNVDMIVSGLTKLPILGRELCAKDTSVVMGSSTAIFACGIAALGAKTGFIGMLGNDQFGDIVKKTLKRNMIDISNIIISKKIKTGITISFPIGNDRAMVTYPGSIEALTIDDIPFEKLDETKHIHIASYFLQKGLYKDISRLFKIAHEKNVTTSLDVGWDDSEKWDDGLLETLKHTDIFFPNETEALNITKKSTVDEALSILKEYAKTTVVKCGPRGAIARTGDNQIKMSAYDTGKPVDTTGAGDSFNAGFIYGFVNGYDVNGSMKLGNACGSISVTRIGGASACATLDEANALIKTGKFNHL